MNIPKHLKKEIKYLEENNIEYELMLFNKKDSLEDINKRLLSSKIIQRDLILIGGGKVE